MNSDISVWWNDLKPSDFYFSLQTNFATLGLSEQCYQTRDHSVYVPGQWKMAGCILRMIHATSFWQLMTCQTMESGHLLLKYGAWASYQIHKIAGCACAGNAGNVFPRRRFQRKPLVSDPDMHHGMCVAHVPWCMSGSLTCGNGENVPGIPGACAPGILRIWQEAHGAYDSQWQLIGVSTFKLVWDLIRLFFRKCILWRM